MKTLKIMIHLIKYGRCIKEYINNLNIGILKNKKNNPDKDRKHAELRKWEGYEYYKIDREAGKMKISGDIIFNFKSVAYKK